MNHLSPFRTILIVCFLCWFGCEFIPNSTSAQHDTTKNKHISKAPPEKTTSHLLSLNHDLVQIIKQTSLSHNIPYSLLLAICEVESNGNTTAFNPNDGGTNNHAFGAFQLLRTTAEQIMEKEDPGCLINYTQKKNKEKISKNCILFDPKKNTELAASYLNHLLRKYNGVLEEAIAAYNLGHVKRLKTGLFVNEKYVSKVKKILQKIDDYNHLKNNILITFNKSDNNT